MRRIGWMAVVLGGLVMAGTRGADAGNGTDGHSFECREATLRGTYGIQLSGSRPLPTGGTESVIGLALRTYDGAGNFTQIDTLKGTVQAIVRDRPGSGTYQVNPDCTAVAQLEPAPGVLIEERMVIVDHGSEIRSMSAAPPPVMVTAIQKRIDRR
jgi:hypothetical protein